MHATASTPVGPYQRKEQVLPAFAHEPVVVPLPESAGGGYAMWKIGCADNATTGSNGTDLVGVCTGCRNGTTQGNCPHPDQVYVSARSLWVFFEASRSGCMHRSASARTCCSPRA